jgi:hypothetical protein
LHNNQYESLCSRLKDRDRYFRGLNKEVILILINDLIKPKSKEPRLIRDEKIRDFIYNPLQILSSFIFPETTAEQRRMYDEWRNQPEERRKRELDNATFILENISHRRRIEYLEDVLRESLLIANNRWIHGGIKYRVVKDKH